VKVIGIVLIVVGLAFAVSGGFSFRERDTILDVVLPSWAGLSPRPASL
jgi:hypothetical protein